MNFNQWFSYTRSLFGRLSLNNQKKIPNLFTAGLWIGIAILVFFLPFSLENKKLYPIDFIGIVFSFFLIYKIILMEKERDLADIKNEADSKIFFLKSRYNSMGQTIGNIAHQWKQPLSAIAAIQTNLKATLLFKGEVSEEKLMKSIDTSSELIGHLSKTIDTFYGFTSLNSNKKSFLIANVFDDIQKITEYSFENSNIKLLFNLQENPTIEGNANEFTHAILNIILNAKDAFDTYSSDKPTITVCVTGVDDICTITVADNAGGICMEPINRIFDWHVSNKEHGSGLGLFITKSIIEEKFGGNITVKNKNGGACFNIELPYKDYMDDFTDVTVVNNIEHINQLSRKILELEQLDKTLKKWSDIFQQAQWGIMMCSAETNTFELMNPSFAQMHGFSVEELSGNPIESVFTAAVIDYFDYIFKNIDNQNHYTFDSVNMRKDGSHFPVSIDITAVKDDNGVVSYCIANVRDIMHQNEANELLKLTSFTMENMREAVFLIDSSGKFDYANNEAINSLGYSKKELLSMSVCDIDSDWPRERWIEAWDAIKAQKTMTLKTTHKRKDGTYFPVEITTNYIEYRGSSYGIALVRDISNRINDNKDI